MTAGEGAGQVEHTPEPWKVSNNDGTSNVYVASVGHGCVAQMASSQETLGYSMIGNARRLVACVNALAGIPTEALESGLVGELLDAAALMAAALPVSYPQSKKALKAYDSVLRRLPERGR